VDIFSAGAAAVRLLCRNEFERGGGLTLRAIARDPALAAAAGSAAAAGFLAGSAAAAGAAAAPAALREFVRRMCRPEPAARPDARACAEFFREWAAGGDGAAGRQGGS
jgi:hypothetical protein